MMVVVPPNGRSVQSTMTMITRLSLLSLGDAQGELTCDDAHCYDN